MDKTALSLYSIHEAEERRRESEERKIMLLFSMILLLLLPPLFIVPFLVAFLRRKDFSRIPTRMVWDWSRLWVLVFLISSFSLFYFIVFPLAKGTEGLMLWDAYFSFFISPFRDLFANTILFFIFGLVIPSFLAVFIRARLRERYKPHIPPDSLLVPTKRGNIVIDRYNTGMMVLGAPGSGKTELIKQIIYQFPKKRDYAWIIFDPKGDYYEEFGTERDIVLSVYGSNYGWNIFWEIEPKRAKTDIIEMAKEIFPMENHSEDKFWVVTSQQLFSAFVTVLYREAVRTFDVKGNKMKELLPTNESFMDFINKLTIEKAYNLLMTQEDLRSVAEYINPKAMKQASGVWSNFYSRLNELFIGDFYKTTNRKQMSIRDYIANPRGRKLFIEYNVETGEAVAPIFRLLIDRAIKYSFSRENTHGKNGERRKKFFIIDEFQLIPKLKRYQELVNFGRSYFITSVIGIQSIAQVIEKYNRDTTNAIVAGHAYLFALRSYDKESTDLIRSRIGKKMAWQKEATSKVVHGHSTNAGDRYSMLEYSPVSEEHIRTMKPGECMIITPDGFREVKLYLFRDAKKVIGEKYRDKKDEFPVEKVSIYI